MLTNHFRHFQAGRARAAVRLASSEAAPLIVSVGTAGQGGGVRAVNLAGAVVGERPSQDQPLGPGLGKPL